jgi:hypothetical protein
MAPHQRHRHYPLGRACYTPAMAKKRTIDQNIDVLTDIVEKGFTAADKRMALLIGNRDYNPASARW